MKFTVAHAQALALRVIADRTSDVEDFCKTRWFTTSHGLPRSSWDV
jgi:hypothetical protein